MAIDSRKLLDSFRNMWYSTENINAALNDINKGADAKVVAANLKKTLNGRTYAAQYPIQYNGTTASIHNSMTNPVKNAQGNKAEAPTDVNAIASGSRWWDEWDYKADISQDRDRQKQMLTNIRNYAKNDSQLFQNRDAYDAFFKYDQRDPSQQRLLDWSFNNYGKFWLNSQENLVADDASAVIREKNDQKRKLLQDNLLNKKKAAQDVVGKLDPKYQDMWNQMEDAMNTANNELNQIKQFVKDSYHQTSDVYDQKSLWEAAWAASTLSQQGLSSAAIAGTVSGIGNKWREMYADNLDKYVDRMKDLIGKWVEWKNIIWNQMWNLTDKEKNLLNDYADDMIALWDENTKALQWFLDEEYNPYEELTQAKVSWTWEKSANQAQKNAVMSNYMAANDNDKVKILLDNVWVDQNVELKWDYYDAIMKIAKARPNDLNAAISDVKKLFSKLNIPTSTWWSKWTSVPKTITKRWTIKVGGKTYNLDDDKDIASLIIQWYDISL